MIPVLPQGLAPDLCYVLSHGFAARMVLHSELIPELQRRNLSIAVIVPSGDEDDAVFRLGEELGVSVVPVERPSGLSLRVSARARPYLYEDVRGNPALWAKHLRGCHSAARSGRALAGFYLLNRVACRVRPLRRALLAMGRQGLRNRGVAALLRRMSPRAVVSTYPVNDFEGAVLLEARRAGILTVGQLLSWDNITSKGRWLVVPDRFIVWGPVMAEELERHYEVSAGRISSTGVPHFDVHINEVREERRAQLLRDLGLHPNDRYLFFGMSSPVFAPTEIDVVEWLAARVEEGRFGPNLQLIIRPHPQNIQGTMADVSWLPRLESLRSQRVAIDYPRLAKSSLPWAVERDDLVHLANLVGGCAVCLNSGSTLSIDAIVQDRPVILPLFDVGPARSWWASVRRVADYLHQRTMLELGGVTVATSLSDTEKAIVSYLGDQSRLAEGRRLVRERELGDCDGQATARVADALERLLHRKGATTWGL